MFTLPVGSSPKREGKLSASRSRPQSLLAASNPVQQGVLEPGCPTQSRIMLRGNLPCLSSWPRHSEQFMDIPAQPSLLAGLSSQVAEFILIGHHSCPLLFPLPLFSGNLPSDFPTCLFSTWLLLPIWPELIPWTSEGNFRTVQQHLGAERRCSMQESEDRVGDAELQVASRTTPPLVLSESLHPTFQHPQSVGRDTDSQYCSYQERKTTTSGCFAEEKWE